MVNIYVAYTQPINPAGVTPVLTRSQVWAGVQRKVRKAQEFVAPITSCKVLKEENNVVTRQVFFKEPFGDPNKPVKEVCIECEPTKVDFRQENGSMIQNIVSYGPRGTEEDLFLTYSFEYFHPEVEAGSTKEQELTAKYTSMSKTAVDSSITAIRKLVVAKHL